MPSYIAPYRGRDRGVPPGFIEAASAPGRLMGEGIADFAKSIATAFEEKQNEAKAEQLQGKAADNLFKALSLKRVEGVDLPDPTVFANLSSRDKAAWASGVAGAMNVREQAQRMESEAARRSHEAQRMSFEVEREKRRALDQAMSDKFDEHLAGMVTLPQGQVGPLAPVTAQDIVRAAAQTGQLGSERLPQLINAVSGLNGDGDSRVGTVEVLPDGTRRMWNTRNSVSFLPPAKSDVQVSVGAAPPGYTVWTDSEGKTRLVKLEEPKASMFDEIRNASLAQSRVKLAQLMELKRGGAKYYRSDNGGLVASGWWGGVNIDNDIAGLQNAIASAEMEAKVRKGAPSTLMEEFRVWEGSK